jgi:hypothetical protein
MSSRATAANKPVAQSLLAKPVRQIPDGDLEALRRKARAARSDVSAAGAGLE